MSGSSRAADPTAGGKLHMKDAAALWQFVRKDPIGRWLGISWAVVAWFALTWLSLIVGILLLLLTAALVYTERRRRDVDLGLDELDDLY